MLCWIGVMNSGMLHAVAARLRMQGNRIVFQRIKNGNDNIGAKKARDPALVGAQKNFTDEVDYVHPKRFSVSAAKFNTISQAMLSVRIRSRKKQVTRQSTEMNLDIKRQAAKDLGGILPTDEKIWRSGRNPSREILESSYRKQCSFKIGKHWENIPGYEERSACPKCGVMETIEHVLTECAIPGQSIVWSLAEELWRKKDTPEYPWGRFLSTLWISACGLTNNKGKIITERSRLYEIIMTSSAHLIWKFRCEHV
ncbi:hypothetical protein EDD85DRAFT_906680 [Armillaria nabsnona]|nr:hypothetical protein EDD85DRAFT_906680 [Armillaria nabsnona]